MGPDTPRKDEKERILEAIRGGERISERELIEAGVMSHELMNLYGEIPLRPYRGERKIISHGYVLR